MKYRLLLLTVFLLDKRAHQVAEGHGYIRLSELRCVLCLKDLRSAILFRVVGTRSIETVCKDCLKEYLPVISFLRVQEKHVKELLEHLVG